MTNTETELARAEGATIAAHREVPGLTTPHSSPETLRKHLMGRIDQGAPSAHSPSHAPSEQASTGLVHTTQGQNQEALASTGSPEVTAAPESSEEGWGSVWTGARAIWSRVVAPAASRASGAAWEKVKYAAKNPLTTASAALSMQWEATKVVGNFAGRQLISGVQHVQEHGVWNSVKGVAHGVYTGVGADIVVNGFWEGKSTKEIFKEFTAGPHLMAATHHGWEALIAYGKLTQALEQDPKSPEAMRYKAQLAAHSVNFIKHAIPAAEGGLRVVGVVTMITPAAAAVRGASGAIRGASVGLSETLGFASKGVSKASLEFFKEIGEKTATKVATSVIKDSPELGKEIAKGALSHVDELVTTGKVPKLTTEVIEKTTHEVSRGHIGKVLETIDAVQDISSDLQKYLWKDKQDIIDALQDEGLTKGAAKRVASDLHALVTNGPKAELVKKELHKSISDPLYQTLEGHFKKDFADNFGEGLKDTLAGAAKKTGKSVDDLLDTSYDDFAKEARKSGEKGFGRGLREGIDDVVERGVSDALKCARLGNRRRPHPPIESPLGIGKLAERGGNHVDPILGDVAVGGISGGRPVGPEHRRQVEQPTLSAEPDIKYDKETEVNSFTGEQTIRYVKKTGAHKTELSSSTVSASEPPVGKRAA
jgi:hypothetical protein